MMKIECIPVGLYRTNCYLVFEENSPRCVVIDPGYQPEEILSRVRELGKTVEAVLLTHGHFDHVGGVKEIAAQTDCKVYLCAEELTLPESFTDGKLFYTDLYKEGDMVEAAGLNFRVMHTPGHTPGSVCLLCGTSLISGDTLFAGSCGRTDLPGGSMDVLRGSLKRIRQIVGDLNVYPGHGPATRLSFERISNPYL